MVLILQDPAIQEEESLENLRGRHTKDKGRRKNTWGSKLLHFYGEYGLVMVNGRVGKDKGIGEFTCLSGKNPSLIDYILVDGCLLSCSVDFEVLEIVGSDHLPLLLEIRVEDRQRNNRVIELVLEDRILDLRKNIK